MSAKAEGEEKERQEQRLKIVWRDTKFLVLGAILAGILSWIEVHAGKAEYRGEYAASAVDEQRGIIDTGYIATKPIHDFLKSNRFWNDVFACINTIIGVFGPGIYFVYETVWVGDYEPVFRYGAISVLRSFCGWFTFLPPDASYLASHYDFPDIMHCLTKDCGDPDDTEQAPFVSFFSGHVATLIVTANHMYLHSFRRLGLFLHVFNVFQIIRLLATRGHYSIDIIIGWYMAIYVSNPAGRLGRYFSRGDQSFDDSFPTSATEAFEKVVGVDDVRKEARMSVIMKMKEVQDALLEEEAKPIYAEPTAKLAVEGKLDEILNLVSAPKEKKS